MTNWNVVYYETIKLELKIKPISECRCDERLKTKPEESTRLSDTGLFGELEHLKIKTRLRIGLLLVICHPSLMTQHPISL